MYEENSRKNIIQSTLVKNRLEIFLKQHLHVNYLWTVVKVSDFIDLKYTQNDLDTPELGPKVIKVGPYSALNPYSSWGV